MGKAEFRTDVTKREQVLDFLVSHRHLIPVARKGHYMMMVPHSKGSVRNMIILLTFPPDPPNIQKISTNG